MRLRQITYSDAEYQEASDRIASHIDIGTVKNLEELERRLKQRLGENYDFIRGGRGTIFDNIKRYWNSYVKPDVEKKAVFEEPSKKAEARRWKKLTKQISQQNMTNILRSEKKLKYRTLKTGERRAYVLHNGRFHRKDNIVVYRFKKRPDKIITRRKPSK
jgi:hypothetical protein